MLHEIIVNCDHNLTTYFVTYYHEIIPLKSGEYRLPKIEAVVAWPKYDMPKRLAPDDLDTETRNIIIEVINQQ